MAVVSRSRRSVAGIVFVVAGALLLLGVILGAAGVAQATWITALAELAIAAALVILAVGSIANLIARISLIAAAVGWLILALAPLIPQLPGGLVGVAAVVAAVGGILGSVVLLVGREITDRSAIAFIATMIVAAIFLFGVIGVFALGQLAVLVTVLLGIGLVLTGILFSWVQRGRRR